MKSKLFSLIFLLLLINKVNNQSSWTSSGCADACAGEPSCTDGCNRQRQQLIYIAIGAGIGLFVLIILIIICCCCLCRKSAKNGKYFELQKIYNQVNKSTITQEQFQIKKNVIIQKINSQQGFCLQNKGNIYPITNCVAKLVNNSQYLTQINIKANDYLGTWEANGFIMNRADGIFMWFYKTYDKTAQLAMQKGVKSQDIQKQHIIFKSTKINMQNLQIQGKWFYVGQQTNNELSGTWKLINNNIQNNNINNEFVQPNNIYLNTTNQFMNSNQIQGYQLNNSNVYLNGNGQGNNINQLNGQQTMALPSMPTQLTEPL